MKTKTMPAVAASVALAVVYALAAVAGLWLISALRERTAVPPDVESSIRMWAAVDGVLALLWVWTALACVRRRESPIVLAIAITTADVLWSVLNVAVWSSELDALELAKALFRGGLVAVVVAWRPRGAGNPTVPLQPASPDGATERPR